jgi:hypothetical protein
MKTRIISWTPGKDESIWRAQQQANRLGESYGVWEHVGLYGQIEGDIEARHTFKTQPLGKPDPPEVWALVACVDPEVKS